MELNTEYNELFRKITEGDEVAFEILFRSLYPSFCLYAHKIIADQYVIEDLVQNVFVSLWNNRNKIKIETSIDKYLIVCLKNECLMYIKRQKNNQNYLDSIKLEVRYGKEPEFISYEELRMRIDQALSMLPEDYRLIWKMSKIENKSNKEISNQLGIPLRTVERHKAMTIEHLRKKLKDLYPVALVYFIVNS